MTNNYGSTHAMFTLVDIEDFAMWKRLDNDRGNQYFGN